MIIVPVPLVKSKPKTGAKPTEPTLPGKYAWEPGDITITGPGDKRRAIAKNKAPSKRTRVKADSRRGG